MSWRSRTWKCIEKLEIYDILVGFYSTELNADNFVTVV